MGANLKGTREVSVIGGLGVSHNHDSVSRWAFSETIFRGRGAFLVCEVRGSFYCLLCTRRRGVDLAPTCLICKSQALNSKP